MCSSAGTVHRSIHAVLLCVGGIVILLAAAAGGTAFADVAPAIPQPPVGYAGAVLRGPSGCLKLRAESDTFMGLVEKVKPDLLIGDHDMMWVSAYGEGSLRFTLDRAYACQLEGEPLKWVLLDRIDRAWEQQLSGERCRTAVNLTDSIPQGDHYPSYAVVKSSKSGAGTVYEIAWEGMAGLGARGNMEERFTLYVLKDSASTWRFIGEGPGEGYGHCSGGQSSAMRVRSEVAWPDTPGAAPSVKFLITVANSLTDSSDDTTPRDPAWRDYTVYREAVLDGALPAKLRVTTEYPYLIAGKGETLETLVANMARWDGRWGADRPGDRDRLLEAWRAEFKRLNPDLPDGVIPEGTRITLGRVDLH